LEPVGPVDWLWEIVECEDRDQLAALWPDPGRVTELLALAKREDIREGLRLVLDGLQESPVLHDPALATTRRAIVALIRDCMRA
jgi:hypothetical protein